MNTDPSTSTPAPGALDTQQLTADSYGQSTRRGMLIAIAIHALFGIAGLIADSHQLAWLQVVSIAVYVACYSLSYRGYRKVTIVLTWLDLLVHSTIAALIAGPDSGFQYYSWILLPLLFANPYRDMRTKVRIATGLSIAYLMIDWVLHNSTPLAQMSANAIAALRYFNLSAFLLAVVMSAVSHMKLVNSAEARLRAAAGTDALTGLLNRRRMSDRMQEQLQKARAERRPPVVLLLDIDHFKLINDEYGHGRGDYVLERISRILRDNVRHHDFVARWGGEEFMVMLPDASIDVAIETAERIRQTIYEGVQRSEKDVAPVSVTIGMAVWRNYENLETTIHRADLALYEGKRTGRNRVVTDRDQATERRTG